MKNSSFSIGLLLDLRSAACQHRLLRDPSVRLVPAIIAATAISASFFLLATGRLKRDSGAETGCIWWKSLRPVHGALWGSFAALKALQLRNQTPAPVVDYDGGRRRAR